MPRESPKTVSFWPIDDLCHLRSIFTGCSSLFSNSFSSVVHQWIHTFSTVCQCEMCALVALTSLVVVFSGSWTWLMKSRHSTELKLVTPIFYGLLQSIQALRFGCTVDAWKTRIESAIDIVVFHFLKSGDSRFSRGQNIPLGVIWLKFCGGSERKCTTQ